MLDITTQVPTQAIGPSLDFIKAEIQRVGASVIEVKSAVAFVTSEASFDPRAYQALSPRLRRLVDLVTVVGPDAADLCSGSAPEIAALA